jgi:hypothetical protein
MSKNTLSSKLLIGASEWSNDIHAPTSNSSVSSLFLRKGNGTNTPSELYTNLAGGSTGWGKQDLLNINFNRVTDSGVIGDGITGNADNLWALIQAVNTAGGGTIYFPPGSYIIEKRLFTLATFEMKNMKNITFLGDGYASKLMLSGNGTLADWYMFYMHDGTNHIRFENLYFDGVGVINPDEQTHLVFSASEAGDTHGGSFDIEITDCYFGFINGDCIRMLGASGKPVTNILAEGNSVVSPHCRTGFSVQRESHHVICHSNFFTGSDDQNIDFEPTGAAPPPSEYIIYGNQVDHSDKSVTCLTFNGIGASSPNTTCNFIYNILHNGSVVENRDILRSIMHGNIFIYTAPLGGDVGISLVDGVVENQVSSNIFDRPNRTTQLYKPITVSTGSATRFRIGLTDNVMRSYGDSGGGQGISIDAANDISVDGNIVEHVNTTANVSTGIRANVSTESSDGTSYTGNMVFFSSASGLAAYSFGTSGVFNFGNGIANNNFSRNSGSGLRLVISGGGSFTGRKMLNGNNFTDITGSIVNLSGFTSGATIEGNANTSAPRFLQAPNAPATAVTAGPGSICLNTAGVNGTVFSYKEVGTDANGWRSLGSETIRFGTQDVGTTTGSTNKFLAPGTGQVSVSATEIKMPITRPTTIRGLKLSCVGGTGSATVTYTVRKNGVNQTLTLGVTNTATFGSSTGTVSCVAGDLISVQVTKTATVTTGQTFVTLSLEASC